MSMRKKRKVDVVWAMIAVLIVCLVMALTSGCVGPEQTLQPSSIVSLSDRLMPVNEKWAEMYGDTLETRMVYNLAVIRFDQRQIFNLIRSYHVDPNQVAK